MKLIFIILSLIFINISLYGQWENFDGPYGGSVMDLKESGEFIFAGTATGGVFRTSDGGVKWESLNSGLQGNGVYSLASAGNMLLAGTLHGIFTSVNNGNNWTSTNSPDNIIYGIAPLEGTGSEIFAASMQGIFISTNNGADWSLTGNSAEAFSIICVGDTVIAGTQNGICRSTDKGITWNCMSSPLVFDFIKTDTKIFAGNSFGTFWESTDYGSSWQVLAQLNGAGFYSLCTGGSSAGNKFYAGTSDGVWVSSDNGYNWAKKSQTTFYPYCMIDAVLFSNGKLFAGSCIGVYTSDSSAVNWSKVSVINYSSITGMTVSGSDIFCTSSREGIFRSSDNGLNWNKVNNGLASITSNDIITAPDGSGGYKLVAGTDAGVYTSVDNGSTWILSLGNRVVNSVLAVNNNGNPELFAATEGSGVLRSTDNGVNWTGISLGLGTYGVSSLASIDSFVFVGAQTVPVGAYRYNIHTIGWESVGLNESVISCIYATQERVFAGTLSPTTGGCFCYSTNQGIGWHIYPGCNPGEVNTMISAGTDLFAGTTGGGVYISRDNGLSWSAVNEGMPESITIDAFCVSDSFLFAGSGSKGMWRRPLSELLTSIEEISEVPDEFGLMQNYPNPFNPSTTISYSIPVQGKVRLIVYDALGREVRKLVDEEKGAGNYEIQFNADGLASGMYFYRLSAGERVISKKMILLK